MRGREILNFFANAFYSVLVIVNNFPLWVEFYICMLQHLRVRVYTKHLSILLNERPISGSLDLLGRTHSCDQTRYRKTVVIHVQKATSQLFSTEP